MTKADILPANDRYRWFDRIIYWLFMDSEDVHGKSKDYWNVYPKFSVDFSWSMMTRKIIQKPRNIKKK